MILPRTYISLSKNGNTTLHILHSGRSGASGHQGTPPPPHGGERHLAQKAWETLGAEQKFYLCYTGTGVGGDRHGDRPPPHPPWGGLA